MRMTGAGLLVMLSLCGCEGEILGPRAVSAEPTIESPAIEPPVIECQGETVVGAEPMLRLTQLQYRQTIRDVLTDFVGAARSEQVVDTAFVEASLLPPDVTPHDPNNRFRTLYTRYSREVDQLHIDGFAQVAASVSSALVPTNRAALLGACASATAPAAVEACVRSFIARLGARLLRHPLQQDEVDRYVAMYGAPTTFTDEGVRDVIAVMLQAPDMVYRIESGSAVVSGDVYELSDSELASRLSYAVWDSAPDQALMAAATSGALRTPAGRHAQLARMFDDPRARAVVDRFTDDWLRLADVPSFTAKLGQPSYETFVAGVRPTAALTTAARDELRTMVSALAFASDGTVSSLVTSRAVFPNHPELARLYGLTAAWDGRSPPPTAADTDRPGLFTRVGLLGTGLISTRPIIKGAFLFDQLLCETLPTPPAGAASQKVTLPAPYSTRQYVEALTEQPGTSCQGCHTYRLNPLGFATEGFDGLGRSRRVERHIDAAGMVLGEVPVNTSAVFQGVTTRRLEGPADLIPVLQQGGRFEACVARQLFRYSFAREETTADACTLEPMWQAARTGSLRDVLVAMADSPAFTRRRIEVAP